MALIGYHAQKKTSLVKTFEDVAKTDADVFQIFFRNPYQKVANKVNVTKKDIEASKGMDALLYSHSAYTLNLAGKPNAGVISNIVDDLRCHQLLGGCGTVIHIGVNKASWHISDSDAEDRAIEHLDRIISHIPNEWAPKLLLENSAGEKGKLFKTADGLLKLYNGVKDNSKLRFCIDTQHLFSAGHDIRQPVNVHKFFADLGNPDKVFLIHLNDSDVPFGKGLDRHKLLGEGYIFNAHKGGSLAALKAIVQFASNNTIPMVCETHGDHQKEMDLVRQQE